MDEIKMFTAIRPAAPADADRIRQLAQARLTAAIAATPDRSPREAAKRPNHRRPVFLAAAAASVAATAAIVVPSVLPASGTGSLVTPAWAIQRGHGGTIDIVFTRALTHQAALQAALRADGVPAYVRSLSKCVWVPRSGKLIGTDTGALTIRSRKTKAGKWSTTIVIHPAAIPAKDAIFIAGTRFVWGLGIQLFLMRNDGPPVCDRKAGSPVRVSRGQS